MASELQTILVDISLNVLDISEKLQKGGAAEIEKLVARATGKPCPPLIKKLYDLESQIGKFRATALRVSMTALKGGGGSGAETAAIGDDPTAHGDLGAVVAAVAAPVTDNVVSVKAAKVSKKASSKKDNVVPLITSIVSDPVSAATPATISVTAPVSVIEPVPAPPAAPLSKKSGKSSDTDSDDGKKKDVAKKPRDKKAVPTMVDAVSPPVAPVVTPVTEVAAVTPSAPIEETKDEEDSKAPLNIKRKKIPKAVRVLCWNLHIGSHKGEDRCMCCKEKKIDVASFHCGHVLAESKGGDLTIKNLRPICASCNSAMGTRSMNEFTKEFFGWEI